MLSLKNYAFGVLLLFLAAKAHAAPPVIVCPPPVNTFEGQSVSFTVNASDPDGDPVTLVLVNPPQYSEFDPPSGFFSWQPRYTQSGGYSLQFQAIAGGQTVSCTVPINVDNFDRPPTIKCPAGVSVTAGDTVKVQVTATDPDGDPLTFFSTSLPSGATLTPQGKLTWPTTDASVGTRIIPFSVTDGTIERSCSVTVTVFANNPPPLIFCPAPQTVTETSLLDFFVGAQPPNGLPLTFTLFNPPAGSSFNRSNGRFTWVPGLSQQGVYQLNFSVSNVQGPPAACSVQVTVLDFALLPPQFTNCPGSVSAPEATPIVFTVQATDPQGYNLTYSAQNVPAGASFNAFTHQFAWTPSYLQAGVYDVTFSVTNGADVVNCTVHITVTDRTGPAPSITCPAPQAVNERSLLTFSIFASDPAAQPVTITCGNLPPGATLTPQGFFSWTPSSTQSGLYLLHFTASNGSSSSQCDVSVNVIDRTYTKPTVICPPDMVDYEQRQILFRVGATDPDGDVVSFTAHGLPGGASLLPDGQFSWTPSTSQSGIYTPEFVATDGESRDSCRVRIEVLDHNAPLATLETHIVSLKDIRPDQGGWVRAMLVAAPGDQQGGSVTAYDLWRRIDGPKVHAASAADDRAPVRTLAEAGSEIAAGVAQTLGFPDGAWEAVAHAPALQALNVLIAAPTRRDSTSAGRPYETYVVTTQTTTPSIWAVSAPESAYSVDDLPPAAPQVAEARRNGSVVALSWRGVSDLDFDRYVVVRGATADFDPSGGTVLGETADSAFVDAHAPDDAFYRVLARDIHGNLSSSDAVPGGAGAAPLQLALGAPRPNPSSAGIAFEVLLPRAGAVSLQVVDARGRLVRTLERSTLPAGRRAYAWDRADDSGRRVAAGIYVLRLEAGGSVVTRKATLTR